LVIWTKRPPNRITNSRICEYLHGHFSEAIFELSDSGDSTFGKLQAQTSD
jgi:hypothetical protein